MAESYAYNEEQMLAGIADYRQEVVARQRKVDVLEYEAATLQMQIESAKTEVKVLEDAAFAKVAQAELARMQTTIAGSRNCKLVISMVAEEFGVKADQIASPWRMRALVLARHVTCHILRTRFELSFPHIGKVLRMHHTSVMYAAEKIVQLATDDPLRVRIENLAARAHAATMSKPSAMSAEREYCYVHSAA